MAEGNAVEYPPFVQWRDVRLPSWANESDRFVVVRVRGDSLLAENGRSIHHGDWAVVLLTADVQEGALAAVLTPAGMTLRFLFREPGERVRLEPSNLEFPIIRYQASEIIIQGRVIRTERDW